MPELKITLYKYWYCDHLHISITILRSHNPWTTTTNRQPLYLGAKNGRRQQNLFCRCRRYIHNFGPIHIADSSGALPMAYVVKLDFPFAVFTFIYVLKFFVQTSIFCTKFSAFIIWFCFLIKCGKDFNWFWCSDSYFRYKIRLSDATTISNQYYILLCPILIIFFIFV
jgi:hypothetical protein